MQGAVSAGEEEEDLFTKGLIVARTEDFASFPLSISRPLPLYPSFLPLSALRDL